MQPAAGSMCDDLLVPGGYQIRCRYRLAWFSNRLRPSNFYRSFAIVGVLFEVIFPVTTFIMLLLADRCTRGLLQNTWVVLSPFFLEAWCGWTILLSLHPIEDPAILVDTFTRIGFDPDTFNDETYAKSCEFC